MPARLVCLCLLLSAAAADPVVLAKDGRALAPIVTGNSDVARYAARELKGYLDRITGATFSLVTEAPKPPRILVGRPAEAAAAGLDLAGLKRDGSYRAVSGGDLILIGRDEAGPWKPYLHRDGQRGTLFAVYDFLEDVCGVRFIKAGPYGEVVPTMATLSVPDGTVKDEPYFLDRKLCQTGIHGYGYPDAELHATAPADRGAPYDRDLMLIRQRYNTLFQVNGCHSSHYLEFDERFAKEHPDWFSLMTDGRRAIDQPRGSYLCYSHPGVIQAFIDDARAYFSGQPPQSRGLKTWNKSGYGDEFMVDPHDSYIYCQCPACRKLHEADPEQDYSEIIFGAVAKVAEGCRDFKGKYISTLAYGPKREPPKTVVLPDNVRIRLCVAGPWHHALPGSRATQLALIEAWSKRTKGDLVLWLYPNAARPTKPIEGAVETGPHAIAAFLKAVKPYVKGAYFENEAVSQTNRFLDEYVMMKLLWDPDQDVDALLADYFARFYGPAAGPIAKVYARLEELWTRTYTIYGGDAPRYASRIDLWEKIYTPAEMKALDEQMAAAEKLAAGDEAYRWRVNLIKNELVGRLHRFRDDFEKTLGVARQTEVVCYRAPVAEAADGLVPAAAWAGLPHERLGPASEEHGLSVITRFKALWTPASLQMLLTCEEPDLADSATFPDRRPDDPELWKDSTVEVFVTYHDERIMGDSGYQVLVNDQGKVADLSRQLGQADWGWNSGAKVAASRDARSWTVRLGLPWQAMGITDPAAKGRLTFNVVRHRSRKTAPPEYYTWSSLAQLGKWFEPTLHGQLIVTASPPPAPRGNLLRNGGLDTAGGGKRAFEEWTCASAMAPYIARDTTVRWDGDSSGRIKMDTPGPACLLQYLPPLKPDTRYRFRCKLRTEKVVADGPGLKGAYVQFYVPGTNAHIPAQAICGTNDWRNLEFEVRTAKQLGADPKFYVRLYLAEATGTVWYDEAAVEEVGP